jgi:hypothetical protein
MNDGGQMTHSYGASPVAARGQGRASRPGREVKGRQQERLRSLGNRDQVTGATALRYRGRLRRVRICPTRIWSFRPTGGFIFNFQLRQSPLGDRPRLQFPIPSPRGRRPRLQAGLRPEIPNPKRSATPA